MAGREDELGRRKYLRAYPMDGGGWDETDKKIQDFYNGASSLLRRDLTEQEWYNLVSTYQADPNLAKSQLADIKAGQDKTDEGAASLQKALPQINEQFKTILGRDATDAEKNHFGDMIKSGNADVYTIGQALQTLPEYTTKQDSTAREKLRGELSAADTKYLQGDVFNAIQSQFAQQGRDTSQNSAALQASLANAAKSMNTDREKYLANIGYQDYSNSRQQTIDQYLNSQARAYQLQDQSTARQYQLTDANQARAYGVQDYKTQSDAYNQYLQNYGRRKGNALLGGLQGALSGAMAGGMTGNPWAALAGGVGGGALGAYGASKSGGLY